MENVKDNLGTVTNAQHLKLWKEIIDKNIEIQISQLLIAKELKETKNL